MKKLWLLAALPLLLAASSPPPPSSPSTNAIWRTDFRDPEVLGKLWQFEGGKFLVPKTRFFLADEPTASSGRILVAEANSATGIMMTAPSPVDLKQRPLLRWRWRVVRPTNVAEGGEEPDDQAGVIYFGDGTLLKQRSVGYRWERNTPIGASGMTRYAAGMMTVKYFCVRNRETSENEWVTEERDVVADYIEAYGKEPNAYFVVSVGANTQYSKSHTRLEVDFIEFIPRRGVKR